MWLNVCVLTLKKHFGAFDSNLLNAVNMLTTAVVTTAGITFGVFVSQASALRLHYGFRDDVFRGNQFDLFILAGVFSLNGGKYRIVGRRQWGREEVLKANVGISFV
ncbi:Uncharacterised protein [Vibrio cholerae]|nr:Uncharacterised protein [Vibrio cholerae]CSD03628.1 Uncharacterised protein [Vibrio cholerae]